MSKQGMNDNNNNNNVEDNVNWTLSWSNRDLNERTPILQWSVNETEKQRARTRSDAGGSNSWRIGVFLLVNTALGAGILNYPSAYDRLGGIWSATVLQMILLVLIASTMLSLIFCADLHGALTYHETIGAMCGYWIQQFSAISIMGTCFGINVTFLVIIGDQFDRLFLTFVGSDFCNTWWLNRDFTIALTAVVLIWPLCYFQKLDLLQHISTMGVFAIFYVIFLTIYGYFALNPESIVSTNNITTLSNTTLSVVTQTKEPSSLLTVIASLPVICFAYQTHEICLPVYSSLAKPRSINFFKATIVSLAVLFVFYALAGTFGYLTFGANVSADIMQMYNANDPFVAVGIVALIIKMITTYPLLMFCGRGAFDGLYSEWRHLSIQAYLRGELLRRVVTTSVWNLFVLLLAIVTPNITIAIEMLGSLAACNVFVFPGLCLLSVARRYITGYYDQLAMLQTENPQRFSLLKPLKNPRNNAQWRIVWHTLAVFAILLILIGCVMFGIVLFQAVTDIQEAKLKTKNNESSSSCVMHISDFPLAK